MPRVAFINKLDRQGANPLKVVKDLRTKLKLNAALVQVPIGLEDQLSGIVDVVSGKAYAFEGEGGADDHALGCAREHRYSPLSLGAAVCCAAERECFVDYYCCASLSTLHSTYTVIVG